MGSRGGDQQKEREGGGGLMSQQRILYCGNLQLRQTWGLSSAFSGNFFRIYMLFARESLLKNLMGIDYQEIRECIIKNWTLRKAESIKKEGISKNQHSSLHNSLDDFWKITPLKSGEGLLQEAHLLSVLASASGSTLLPRLPSEPGMTLLTIRIEKIGLKDAGQCIDPYITVSVKDLNGIDLTPVQDTTVASRKEDTYVHFNVDIELQKHIEKLTKGAAIFFEFKHYKPKKRFTSTKCFAFMEMDEIKPGPIVIELYKKPTDFKRKKLQLLTKKPLYLHLHQTLHKE
ncbi:axin interactor, dorsalization-associated protein-like [Callospermophilus lateralis]